MNLMAGDILLMGHEGSPIARSVRMLSDSPWNHCGIVGPDGVTVYHCPGAADPAVASTPAQEFPSLLLKPGYGHVSVAAYRQPDPDVGERAAAQAMRFFQEQPFAYSMTQNTVVGTLLWAQQTSDAVNAIAGVVLDLIEDATDDAISGTATNCTEFVWRCYDDTDFTIDVGLPYYQRGDDERDPIEGIQQELAPDKSSPGYTRHRHDTALNRAIERLVMLTRRDEFHTPGGRRPTEAADLIPDLLVPRDFAGADGFSLVAAWPRNPWPPR